MEQLQQQLFVFSKQLLGWCLSSRSLKLTCSNVLPDAAAVALCPACVRMQHLFE
jgi:hypothetical protein